MEKTKIPPLPQCDFSHPVTVRFFSRGIHFCDLTFWNTDDLLRAIKITPDYRILVRGHN